MQDTSYSVDVIIEGTSPLLQHAFTPNHLAELAQRARQQTGAADYTYEWMTTMYIARDNGADYICQPASHIEGAMLKAATAFKIAGRRGKTWKDPVKAYVYVSPDNILHLRNGNYVPIPGIIALSIFANEAKRYPNAPGAGALLTLNRISEIILMVILIGLIGVAVLAGIAAFVVVT